ncbi:molybdenum cofactor biosynthesis protein MoaE [Limimaricola hongkongensis]|uniref:Molybdopterin synthase catalytic subunit n=1 Tax=Limimaricola hongkongensis DSM 17492 TaxID=1122180 RepID=A0A017HD66_9RHOB|nr:molybdenum cofactor biosynthesis protein MoaE [Limimaricola hongkongensis]EYD72053.1 Molybdenum cofactor biosynthesis protein MoaE/ Molybdopterin converting factor subunit 2 [Limimaricola hongkongensis DSM 17492]
MKIRVQEAPFDAGAELDAFAHGRHEVGAVVSFTGIVRDRDGGLVHMQIEHYPGMTEKAITAIAETAKARWDLADLVVIHRFGTLPVGQPIMMVATAAPHRRAAFEAAEYLMDYLKSRAPFWKKEVTQAGEHWVEATPEDEDALSRW